MDDRELTVQRWLMKAERDLRTAEVMLIQPNPPTDVVCYHAQQCVEKLFKAWLTSKNVDFPKTHDLTRLLKLCVESDGDFEILKECAIALTDYAVETRYPDEWRDISSDEASDAVKWAAHGLQFVSSRMKSNT